MWKACGLLNWPPCWSSYANLKMLIFFVKISVFSFLVLLDWLQCWAWEWQFSAIGIVKSHFCFFSKIGKGKGLSPLSRVWLRDISQLRCYMNDFTTIHLLLCDRSPPTTCLNNFVTECNQFFGFSTKNTILKENEQNQFSFDHLLLGLFSPTLSFQPNLCLNEKFCNLTSNMLFCCDKTKYLGPWE